jgi:predicted regulator of Ras-like GTPase activity (Roadblock/LC7/MglB family)/anti-sigma regulatory factor (Ser/Thr protein kinase)
MQALATGMLADLRAMEERHSDEDVLADLLHLDHRTAQAGRLADSVAVLTGARSGRRWARPIAMESILRGAMGRISGYQRVRVHSASDTAVAGHAAEGVMHALAELLDNAANFSPPSAEVHVYVEEVPAGVIVSVEDSGLVMGDIQLRRAERAVSGDSTELGGLTGTRLGLAVVGRLARKYGLKVSYRPSARGGTGVLMLVPQDILVPQDAPTRRCPWTFPGVRRRSRAAGHRWIRRRNRARAPPSVRDHPWMSYAAGRALADLDPDPVPTHESPERGVLADAVTDVADALPEGLPKRRRGQALAEAERSRARAESRCPRRPRPLGRRHPRPRRPLQQFPPGRTRGDVGGGRPYARTAPATSHPERPPVMTGPSPSPPHPLPLPLGRQPHLMTGTTTADEKLTWLIEGLLERTPGARHALVLSRDGLKLCRTPELSVDQADQLAAIAAGIQSLSHGASVEFGDGSGGVRSAMTEFYGGVLFIVEAGEGAHLALVTAEDADAGLIGHNMSELVEQLGEHLRAEPRSS